MKYYCFYVTSEHSSCQSASAVMKIARMPRGRMIEMHLTTQSYLIMSLHCDLDLEYSKPIFSQDTLSHFDVPPYQVWLQKVQQFRRYGSDRNQWNSEPLLWPWPWAQHINTFVFTQQPSFWCDIKTKFGCRRIRNSEDIAESHILITWAFTVTLTLTPQWGAADAEIKVPSGENTELKRSPFKAWSRSVYSHTCYAYCHGFLPCLFLSFRSIRLHFFQNLSWFLPCWLWLTHGSCVGPQNKIGHPAGCRFPCWVPAEYK